MQEQIDQLIVGGEFLLRIRKVNELRWGSGSK